MASIKKRGNSYRIFVSNGRNINGKQIMETTTFIPDPEKTEKQNQKALDIFALEFEQKVKNGKYLDGEKITFQDFKDLWLTDYAEKQLELTTTDIYKILLDKHITPAIGNIKLAKIQPANLNKLYNTLLKERKDKKEGGYSPTTIKRVHALISSILSTAVRWNVLLENPCERVSPPKQTRNSRDVKFFTLEECSVFLAAVDTQLSEEKISLQHKVFFHLALFCGMRRGELIALEWSDFDFTKKSVNINKSTGLVDGKAITKSTKNKSSERIVSVPESVVLLLKQYQIQQYKYRLSIGSHWQGNNNVFIQLTGKQMYPSSPYGVFKDVLRRYNESADAKDLKLPDIPLHGLRHTSATLLISKNMDIRTVSGRLGHAQTSTTMNIYSHSLQTMDVKASDTLEDLFKKKEII